MPGSGSEFIGDGGSANVGVDTTTIEGHGCGV